MSTFKKDLQYYKFCCYGFLKNLKFFAPFFLLFLKDKGISYLDIGILYAIRETTIYVMEIPSGIIADVLGRKKTLVSSFVFYIASFLIFYFLSGFGWMVAAMLLFAHGDAFRTGTHKAMIFEYLKINGWEKHKVSYYGQTRSFSQFGSAISSLIAVVIIFFANNYRAIFLYSTIPFLLDGILILTYPRTLDGTIFKLGQGTKSNFTTILRSLSLMFRQEKNIRLLLNVASFSGFFKVSKDYLQVIIQFFAVSVPVGLAISQQQKTALFVGILFFLLYVLTMLASRHSEKVSHWFGSHKKMLNILLLLGVCFGMLSGLLFHYGFYALSLVLFALIYINENLRKPVGMSVIAESFGSETLATTLSVESLTNTLIGSITAVLVGLMADKLGIGLALTAVSVVFTMTTAWLWVKT